MSDVIEYDEKEQERERKVHAVEASSFDIPPYSRAKTVQNIDGNFFVADI